jgi:peptidoglycan-N-acetylglucosamine deacetylase
VAYPWDGWEAGALRRTSGSRGRLTLMMESLRYAPRALAEKRRLVLIWFFAVHCYMAPAFATEDPSLFTPVVVHVTQAREEENVSTRLPPLPQDLRNSIRRVQLAEGKKLISFTFDLCERENETAGYDAEVVSILRKYMVKASFFASGKWMRSHPEQTMQLMVDPLFELGNHGWAHENFRLLDKREAEERFLRTQVFYEALHKEVLNRFSSGGDPRVLERIPCLPLIFRFPFGTCNPDALELLAAHGVAAIQWDVVSGDAAKGQTPKAITEVVLKQSKPGSIIIFHANGRGHGTAQALPGLISTFRERGFDFATVTELLAAGKPITSTECYELRPADNKRYDRFK